MRGDHENSIVGFYETTTERARRRVAVMEAFKSAGRPLTDREVCHALGFNDMNAARPRISEAIDDGLLIEVGKVRDELTGRLVRLVKVREVEQQMTLGDLCSSQTVG
jgi:hypothetical protein